MKTVFIDGVEYKYEIGKKFTKIKNIGIFENSKIGMCVKSDPILVPKYVVKERHVHGVLNGYLNSSAIR